ncbi:hypothetical protein [Streptomyces sp. MP131-18]|uniref:hypothetical protein n=1 Tax=Streptomyces sp. MP131-18 TaxID=1857892 RepID=UPI0009C7848D|nr:hypothetical protein [Streptomyces sp. MP131-18]ONK12159.1 hypothetical protein STBA_28980 [Streptomyces sp. MP131-18]
MASDAMEIPTDSDFIEVLGSVPEPAEQDPDVWRVEIPVGHAGEFVTLSFDVGARSVRLTRESAGRRDIEFYREQVNRILLYSRDGERGVVVEVDVPGFKCELRIVVFPGFTLVDPMLYLGL